MPSSRYASFQDRLIAADDRPSGFDYLRLILALFVFGDHTAVTCFGMGAQHWLFGGATRALMTCIVPMFFALSGFLVANSLIRSRSIVTFIGLRLLRIIPALAMDTLFCALILGVALTDLPLHDYFRSRDFLRYFLNILGDIHYMLPGVFARNPTHTVNIQLWTIPHELQCYLALTILGVLGLHRNRHLFLLATCLVVLATGLYIMRHPVDIIDIWQLLLPSFLLGVCTYLYRERLEWSPRMVGIALSAMIVLLNQTTALMLLAAFPIAYVAVWLGLLQPKRNALIRSGDYSYALYLYSFPIQQAVIALLPWGRIWWANVVLALPTSFAFAMLSWHLIEKPVQANRHYLYSLEAWRRSRRQVGQTALVASTPTE